MTTAVAQSEIRTEGLIKSFGPRNVVNGVDLHFKAGEVVGLLGPNGAGKTSGRATASGIYRRKPRCFANLLLRKTSSPSPK